MSTKDIKFSCGAVSIQAGESEGDTKGPATFDVVAYNGGPLVVGGHDLPVVLDGDSLKFARSIKANLDHDSGKRVGHVTEKVKGEHGSLRLIGKMSAATPHREEVVASAKDGFEWEASIEASRGSSGQLETIRKGKSVTVNGQTFEGPLYVARGYTLTAFAFLSHGADPETTVNIAAQKAASQREINMDAKFVSWLEARDWNPAEVEANAKQLESLQAAFDAENGKVVSKKKPATDAEVIAAARARRERETAITAITADALASHPDQIDVIEAMHKLAIESEQSPEQYELAVLKAERPNTGLFRPRSTGSNGKLTDEVLQAAICLTGRLENIDKKFSDQTLSAAEKQFPNGIGLKQLMILGARANGYNDGYGNDVDIHVQRAAFGMAAPNRQSIHASGFSTLSVPGILSATANKFLQEGWMAVDQTWRAISAIRAVKDFKTVTSYSLTGSFEYEQVGAGGELKHGTVGEETYTNKADTYGKMFAITRTDIINDDLGALTAVPRRLGRGAALKLNDIFWTEFLNNSSFFASGYSNVSTGAGSALGLAGLTAAELVFLNQTDPNGKPLGVMPSILLVPPALKRTAMALMNSMNVVSTTTANTPLPDGNTFANNYSVESSPYLSNSNYTGYSSAAWYLLAKPSDGAVIEVCFLNGKDTPVVESADADFNVLGVQMRGYIDAGVNLQEPRFGVRSAGS